MRVYRLAVAALTAGFAGFGVMLAVFVLPPGVMLALAVVGAVVVASLHPQVARAASVLGVQPLGRPQLCGGAAVVCTSVGGMVGFIGPSVWGGVLVLGLCWLPLLTAGRSTASRVVSWSADVRGSAAHEHEADFDEQLLRPLVAEWSDARLCDAWRRSFAGLHGDGVPSTAALAEVRRVYLDELRARHPIEFDAWFLSGARSTDDPTRHLGRRSRRPAE